VLPNTAIPSATGPDGTTPVTEDDTANDNTTATDTLQSPVANDDGKTNPGIPSPSNPTTLDTIGANDNDPDGTIDTATIDLDPTTPGIQSTLSNSDGTYSAQPVGDVIFTPNASLTGDPAPITYTVNDNDGNTSNIATLTIKYGEAPTAVDDATANPGEPSPSNPTTLLDITNNDFDSDVEGTIEPSTVDLDPTTPGIQSTLNNADGDYVVDGAGNVTFTPNAESNNA